MQKNTIKTAAQNKRAFEQRNLSRLWFLGQGCRPVPTNVVGGRVLYGHPLGYFLTEKGNKLGSHLSPSARRAASDPKRRMGKAYPIINGSSVNSHIAMALAFYGPRPTFTDANPNAKANTYVGICHHLIPDALDFRPANLLCWLTREQHYEADRRQRALDKVLPTMHALFYEEHRKLQDPRVTSRDEFERELARLEKAFRGITYWDPAKRQDYEMTHHMEE